MSEVFKTCSGCGTTLRFDDFYKTSKGNPVAKCKGCTKMAVKKYRENNLEKVKEYDRNRPNQKQRNIKNIERAKCKSRSVSILQTKKNWSKRNPLKRRAQHAANNALRDGRISRKEVCEHCGIDGVKLQKHHHSYEEKYWLHVIWLCTKCHGLEHRRLNEIGRDPDNFIEKENK